MGVRRCRASLEEMVLNGEGRLRWKRLENLVQEGSKSSDYSGDQLWMLADWLLSDAGRGVRGPVVREVARLLDAYVAGACQRPLMSVRGPKPDDACSGCELACQQPLHARLFRQIALAQSPSRTDVNLAQRLYVALSLLCARPGLAARGGCD